MRMLRFIAILLIMAMASYPIIELTRVIIHWGPNYFPEMKGLFALELAIMWTLYLLIPVIFIVMERALRRIN